MLACIADGPILRALAPHKLEREREQENQTPPSPILLVSFDNTCCRGYRYAVFHNKRVSKFLIFDTD